MLPFIRSIIHIGHFDRQLNQLLTLKTKQLSQLYTRSAFVTQLLGIFLNIATIPLLVQSLSLSLHPFPDDMTRRFYSRSLLRAYALALTWSPFEVLVSISIDTTNETYYKIFPFTFLLSIVFMILNRLLFSMDPSSHLAIQCSDLHLNKRNKIKRKMFQLIGIFILFIVIVSLMNRMTGFGFLFSVVLVILPFSITIAFIMKKWKRYMIFTIPHWKRQTHNLSNYFFMFLTAGFFVDMIAHMEWISILQSFLAHFINHKFIFYLIIGVYFFITALAGFHPLVSLTLFVKILSPVLSQVSSLSFALVLISCSLATVMYSPYNVSVSLLSSEIKVNPYRITQWNIAFALFYMLIGISFAYWLHFSLNI
ncbi:hypothetical protein [Collibacillus ludicampi]|uniref:hypothetical protein n=1 Tax=Collibacillus ludicampi TaxID=2771369 RepID=UPI002495129C|nr:hypothetical protein [Collibacillus ludicampi]